jgi:hypothetical protein
MYDVSLNIEGQFWSSFIPKKRERKKKKRTEIENDADAL